MSRWALPVLLLAATLTLPTEIEGCRLDQAFVTLIPPDVVHVAATTECGLMRCWQKWVEQGGKRIGHVRACSVPSGSGEQFKIEEPGKPVPPGP